MSKRFIYLLICSLACAFLSQVSCCADYKSKEIKYQYNVLKQDLRDKRDSRIINRTPSGYMTVEEYEKASEYKDKTKLEFEIPKVETPSDYKYIPHPLYKLVKYNDPPGQTELSLGQRLFINKQINAPGIISPDFTQIAYPAIYYYQDTGSVAADVFVIPLNTDEAQLTRVLKANTAKRNPIPILSTDKAIDNYAAFRTLTPVDFSQDGSKLLIKEKLGSSQDGIWETNIYIYDFINKTSYDISVIRDAISYFWQEYMKLNLEAKRWDIYPLGFDSNNPDRVVVQAYAYTGEKPVYLGAWSIDSKAERSQLISFESDFELSIESNGYKVVKDGVESYQTVKADEKLHKKQDKIINKLKKKEDKKQVKSIKEDYKYELKDLKADYKDDYRDYKKLRKLKGSTETIELQQAYEKYLHDQLKKDIIKTEKQIKKQQKKIDKTEQKIQKITDKTQILLQNDLKDIYDLNQNKNDTLEVNELEN